MFTTYVHPPSASFFYGLAGSVFGATYAYFNGTITTIEKRYKIPSQNTGIISVGNDISSLFVSAVLAYYAGKGHRPRWLAAGLVAIVIFCLLTTLPHFLYGPGQQALSLTREYGSFENDSRTLEILEKQRKMMLCNLDGKEVMSLKVKNLVLNFINYSQRNGRVRHWRRQFHAPTAAFLGSADCWRRSESLLHHRRSLHGRQHKKVKNTGIDK
jgi:hypothetical protein